MGWGEDYQVVDLFVVVSFGAVEETSYTVTLFAHVVATPHQSPVPISQAQIHSLLTPQSIDMSRPKAHRLTSYPKSVPALISVPLLIVPTHPESYYYSPAEAAAQPHIETVSPSAAAQESPASLQGRTSSPAAAAWLCSWVFSERVVIGGEPEVGISAVVERS